MSSRASKQRIHQFNFALIVAGALAVCAPALHAVHAQQPTVLTRNRSLGAPVSPYDARVSPYSPKGALNPYTSDGGRIFGADGTYLGRLNSNRYDPKSVANPYGEYGSKYSRTSINNPYGEYGSKYSNTSARNPYASAPPVVVYERQSPDSRPARTAQPALSRVVPVPVTPWRRDRP